MASGRTLEPIFTEFQKVRFQAFGWPVPAEFRSAPALALPHARASAPAPRPESSTEWKSSYA